MQNIASKKPLNSVAKTSARQLLSAIFALVSLLAAPSTVWATTILGMDIDAVAKDAELIFEGEVVQHDTQLDNRSGIVNTFVTFAVNDVINGEYSGNLLELKFTGGVHNGQIVEVSGLTIPAVGERGIYFVESISEDLINPLLGWSQGHFVILEENGERRVHTVDQQPVTDVMPVSSIPPAIKKPLDLIEGNSDAAVGVLTEVNALSVERAMTVDSFKTRILEIIEN